MTGGSSRGGPGSRECREGSAGCFNQGPNGISHSGARSSFIAGKAAMIYIELEELERLNDEDLEQRDADRIAL